MRRGNLYATPLKGRKHRRRGNTETVRASRVLWNAASWYHKVGILLTHSNCDHDLRMVGSDSILSWRERGSGYEKTEDLRSLAIARRGKDILIISIDTSKMSVIL